VAAGRRIIGAPRPEDEAAELESPEPTPSVRGRGGRGFAQDDTIDARPASDGYAERIIHPVAEPLATPEEFIEPDAEEIDLDTDDGNDLDIQDEVVDDTDIPDMDLGPAEVEEEDDLFDEEDEDEDDEDDDSVWSRGRKRNKPVRPKIPPKKTPRREPRRGF
jgi:hypothetical protein